jgi:hypothetical protein
MKQVGQGDFPLFAIEKVVGDPVSFFGDACLADIGTKAAE